MATTPDEQPQRVDHMTGRERIMAALNGQPVDRIPFVPLVGPYTLMDMPQEVAGEALGGGFDPRRMIAVSRKLGCDLLTRHVAASEALGGGAPHLQMLGRFELPVEVAIELKESQLSEILTTPVGSLTGRWKFTDRVGVIPHFVKYAVDSYEDMKVFHYAVDHLTTEPVAARYDTFVKIEDVLGDDGVATASISNSPFMYLIEFVFGLENTYLLLLDHRQAVEDILQKLHASQRRYVEVLAASPAKVIIQYENTSSTLLSPTYFRRYCLPYLNDYADILRGAGKIYLIHMCGRLHGLVDDINQGRFNGICDVAPHPTGDLPLDEAAARLPGKVVIGGIDANTFICEDAESVKAEVSGLIERIKPFPGVLLGSADVTPRGTLVENLRLIRQLVDTLGTYN